MKRDELLNALKNIEWAAYNGEIFADTCPYCECTEFDGHTDCKLDEAIAWLDDEKNERRYVEITGTDSAPAPRGWLLR